ncbi:MAG: membrane protease subunit (stomatin/prohibitin family) [Myxococcota bacterium]
MKETPMGLWDTLKQHAGAQFLDVIQWLDDSNDTMVYRFPIFNQAITDKSKLVVREGQAAVFIHEGVMSDVFGPGTYTLDTRNAPITGFFQSISYGLNMPYKGDIYFIDTTQFTENRWGTSNPVMMRDAEFGPVRIRAFGIYSFRVTDPEVFLKQVVGTDGLFTTDEITGQLKRKLVSGLADTIGKAKIPVLDLAANYMDLGDQLRDRMNPAFNESYGITLTDFTIENISLPANVEKALDDRSRMGVLGNLGAYQQLKSADAIEVAAGNTGLGGAGVGMGVGFGMGNMMGNQMSGSMNQAGPFNAQQGMQGGPAPVPPPVPGQETWHYNGPTGQAQLKTAELVQRITQDRSGNHQVWKAGMAAWQSWKDVPELATALPPGPPPMPAATSYHYAGADGQSEKSLDEVVAAVKADPDGKHHVWQDGWDGWKSATDLAEVKAALSAGPPPPPSGGPPPPPM